MTSKQRWNDLDRWLRSPNGDHVLDDAVLGSLTVDEVHELLEDYGLPTDRTAVRMFAGLLDAALAEGF